MLSSAVCTPCRYIYTTTSPWAGLTVSFCQMGESQEIEVDRLDADPEQVIRSLDDGRLLLYVQPRWLFLGTEDPAVHGPGLFHGVDLLYHCQQLSPERSEVITSSLFFLDTNLTRTGLFPLFLPALSS